MGEGFFVLGNPIGRDTDDLKHQNLPETDHFN